MSEIVMTIGDRRVQAETGMTVGALKVAVHRGLKALRAAMTGTER